MSNPLAYPQPQNFPSTSVSYPRETILFPKKKKKKKKKNSYIENPILEISTEHERARFLLDRSPFSIPALPIKPPIREIPNRPRTRHHGYRFFLLLLPRRVVPSKKTQFQIIRATRKQGFVTELFVNADVFREPIGTGEGLGRQARVSRPEVVPVLGVAPWYTTPCISRSHAANSTPPWYAKRAADGVRQLLCLAWPGLRSISLAPGYAKLACLPGGPPIPIYYPLEYADRNRKRGAYFFFPEGNVRTGWTGVNLAATDFRFSRLEDKTFRGEERRFLCTDLLHQVH